MIGITIQPGTHWKWVNLSLLCAFIGYFLWFFQGPWGAILVGVLGLLLAAWAAGTRVWSPSKYPSLGYPAMLGLLYIVLLFGAWYTSILVSPLVFSEDSIPALNEPYSGPDDQVSLKGPSDWGYQPLVTEKGSGFSLRPIQGEAYIGIQEIRVLVEPLAQPVQSSSNVLGELAENLKDSIRSVKSTKMFQLETAPAQLLNGEEGLWVQIIASPKWFFSWITIKQLTLWVVKKNQIVCSLTITGPASHDQYFRPMALKLMENLAVSPPGKN